jgi:hypothetical protein
VKLEIVLEVTINSIQPGTRHASGLALRFPGIKESGQSGVTRMGIPSTLFSTFVVSPSATHKFIGQF